MELLTGQEANPMWSHMITATIAERRVLILCDFGYWSIVKSIRLAFSYDLGIRVNEYLKGLSSSYEDKVALFMYLNPPQKGESFTRYILRTEPAWNAFEFEEELKKFCEEYAIIDPVKQRYCAPGQLCNQK